MRYSFSSMCLEIVRAMTYVINQGLALYWGTSRWGATEIMVSVLIAPPLFHTILGSHCPHNPL